MRELELGNRGKFKEMALEEILARLGISGAGASLPFFNAKDYGAVCDGTDDSAAIQRALDTIPSRSLLYVPGPTTLISSGLIIKRYVHLKINGQLLLGTDNMVAFSVGDPDAGQISRVFIEVDEVLGTGITKGQVVVLLRNTQNNVFHIWRVDDVGSVVKVQGTWGNQYNGENTFHFLEWHTCDKAVYFPSTATCWAEGNNFYGGMISVSNYGFKYENGAVAGGSHIIACIDNITLGGYDYVNEMSTAQLGNLIMSRYIRYDASTFSVNDRRLVPSPCDNKDRWMPHGPTGSPYTVPVSDCYGSIQSNSGATGTYQFNLPAAVGGMDITFYNIVAQVIRIDPNGTDRILVMTGTAGDYLDSDGAIGSFIRLRCYTAGYWVPFEREGVWTEE